MQPFRPLLAGLFALAAGAAPAASQPARPASPAPANPAPAAPAPAAPVPANPASANPALAEAVGRYPQLIMGPGIQPTDGTGPVPTYCGALGGVVEARGAPALVYRGADPKEPELCNFSVGGQDVQAWFGIWVTSWPGAEQGRAALREVIGGRTGDIQAFDVVMTPQLSFHDMVRNEGVEELGLLGYTYTTLKISHYREGFNGNNYRSVATVWKDFATGMILYATYQHISGQPVLDDPLDPTAITPPP